MAEGGNGQYTFVSLQWEYHGSIQISNKHETINYMTEKTDGDQITIVTFA